MTRLAAYAALALLASPVAAQESLSPDLAESRLRGCILAGASAAPQGGLREAVISVRAFCGAQIARVRDQRVATATAGLKGQERKDTEAAAIRALNHEIAVAVANFTD